MDRDNIVARAKDYLAHESETKFRSEVEELLGKTAGTGADEPGRSSRTVSTGTSSSVRAASAASSAAATTA